MLHLLPTPDAEAAPQPYAEAVARLASVRHALRLVDAFGGGPACDLGDDEAIAAAWPEASDAQRRSFNRRTGQIVASAAAGLEALLDERGDGREPHPEASRELVEQIRRELAQVSRAMLG